MSSSTHAHVGARPPSMIPRAGLPAARAFPMELQGHPDPDGPPSLHLAWGELTSGRQALRLTAAGHRLRKTPRALRPGSVVIDVPGWAAPEALHAPLRSFLRRLGYDARGWGFGRHRGEVHSDVHRLEGYLAERILPDEPASLVGWSLGGLIVREVARRRPDLVRNVVTFGTPVVGGTAHTVGGRFWQPAAQEHSASDRLAAYTEDRDRRDPLRVPLTVILSRRDGVVNWHSCLDHHSPLAEHVEVESSHIGMVLDPDVWSSVASGLAREAATDASPAHMSSRQIPPTSGEHVPAA